MNKTRYYAQTAAVAFIAALAVSAPSAQAQDASSTTTQSPPATQSVPVPAVSPLPQIPAPRISQPSQPATTLSAPTVPQSAPSPATVSSQALPSGVGDPESATPVNQAAVAQIEEERAAAAQAAAERRAAAREASRTSATASTAAAAPATSVASETAATSGPNLADRALTLDAGAGSVAPLNQSIQQQVGLEQAQPAPAPAPAPVADQASAANDGIGDDVALWGGLALILGLGGVGAAAAMRRRSDSAETTPVVAKTEPVREPMPARDSEPVAARPAMARTTPEPVVREPARMAPSAMPAAAVATGSAAGMGRHQIAAMRGPTSDNPFLTLRNRMKRARFYDQRERAEGMAPVEHRAVEQARAPAAAKATAPARKPMADPVARAKEKIGSITDAAAWQIGGKPSYSS
ncbi:hypothetical protein [Sphingosinithalassobacter portus]|uniref:hypothetical protein n=1 Tax=Stakelama portus TaxID=2676234 RepID=UPI00137AFC09|nr:hypothetical protein [Sphingosinithalassobacter portus]